MNVSVKTISELVGGNVVGDASTKIHAPAKIEEARKGNICFYNNEKYAQYLTSTEASAIIISNTEQIEFRSDIAYLQVENVLLAVSQLLEVFNVEQDLPIGVHSTAIMHDQINIDPSVRIGPHTVISKDVLIGSNSIIYGQVFLGNGVKIGKNVKIFPGVKIYHNCEIGDNCILHANAVIGTDGFGFVPNDQGAYDKIQQVGNVVIENNVEIGSNCAIDRASMGSTRIKEGVKLDNLIHVAHNVEIGEHTVMAAQVGIAGSTKIGKYCMVGGQVGIVGHLNIADQTQIQAQSGMIKSVKETNTKWYGYPAIKYNNYLRSFAGFKNLPNLIEEVRSLKSKIRDLEDRMNGDI